MESVLLDLRDVFDSVDFLFSDFEIPIQLNNCVGIVSYNPEEKDSSSWAARYLKGPLSTVRFEPFLLNIYVLNLHSQKIKITVIQYAVDLTAYITHRKYKTCMANMKPGIKIA